MIHELLGSSLTQLLDGVLIYWQLHVLAVREADVISDT